MLLPMGIIDWLLGRETKNEDPYDCYRRGRDAMDSGDWPTAIAQLSLAGDTDSSLIDAFHYRGVAYLMRGQFQRAIDDFDHVLEFRPRFAEAYLSRGHAFDYLGQSDRALVDLDQAVELAPHEARIYNSRGITHLNLGQLELAVSDFQESIRLEPDQPHNYFSRAMAYYNLAEYRLAIEDLDAVLAKDPTNAEAYFQRGLAHLGLEKQDKANADMVKAVEFGLDPRSVRRLVDYRPEIPGSGATPASE